MNKFKDPEITEYAVRNVIKSLPNKYSDDKDGFSYAILKGSGIC